MFNRVLDFYFMCGFFMVFCWCFLVCFFLDFFSFFWMRFLKDLGLIVLIYLVIDECVLGLMVVKNFCCDLVSLVLEYFVIFWKLGCIYFLYSINFLWNWGNISYVVMVNLIVEYSGI